MSITIRKITPLPQPPTSTDSQNFRVRADEFLVAMQRLTVEINDWSTQVSGAGADVEYNTNLTLQYRNDAIDAKNAAYAYKEEAINAANRVEAVAIPTEATYKTDEIDTMLNSALTQIVALQAQIAVLHKEQI